MQGLFVVMFFSFPGHCVYGKMFALLYCPDDTHIVVMRINKVKLVLLIGMHGYGLVISQSDNDCL